MNGKITKLAVVIYFAALCNQNAKAQIGFGTKLPSEASVVEIRSDDKGLLIPRISLTDLTSFSPIVGAKPTEISEVNAMLIYNLTNDPTNNILPGFYYWTTNGTLGQWNRIATNSDVKTQPWFLANSTNQATLNNQNIYQNGNIGIGDFSAQLPSQKLDIYSGNVRIRELTTLVGDTLTDKVVLVDNTGVLRSVNVIGVNKLTKLELEAETTNVVDKDGQIVPGLLITSYTLIYTDEAGVENKINMNALVESAETLTFLTYDAANHELVYTDEKSVEHRFNLVDLVGDAQTLTSLTLDIDTKRLIYKDEDEITHSLNLAPIIQEPWYGVTTNTGAVSNTEDIFTQGWVGIGYSSRSTAPNEKLRVNGSISAVNNYYADYVFEDYFQGYSDIKTDYEFKTLDEVQTFIKLNKHLPGITPIHELERTEEGYSFNISELSIQLLEKTEELYLHTIEQESQLKVQSKQIEELQMRLIKLEQLLNSK